MQNLHWDLNTIENQDYAELMEVLAANSDGKMMAPEEMMQQWNGLN